MVLPGWEEGLFQKSLEEKGDFTLGGKKVSLRWNYQNKEEAYLSFAMKEHFMVTG